MIIFRNFFILCAIGISSFSLAADKGDYSSYLPGITAKLGTLGGGLDLTLPLVPGSFNARVGVSGYAQSLSATYFNTTFDADVRLFNVALLADFHPWKDSGFRLTGGAMYNGNQFDITGRPNGTVNFNGVNFAAGDIANVDATVDFMPIVPYFGLGWGNAANKDSNFHFAFDIGAMYQGKPQVNINVSCSSALPAATCAGIQANAKAEEQDIAQDLADFKFYPVLQIGVSYSF